MQIVERFFTDSLVTLGKFRCPISHPMFYDSGPARGHLMVFPRESVEIRQANRDPVVANANVVVLYNKHQDYERRRISPWGDRCEFLDVHPQLLVELIRPYNQSIEERAEEPFEFSSFVSSPRLVLKQRRLIDIVAVFQRDSDSLAWESAAIELLEDSIAEAFGEIKLAPEFSEKHRDLVHHAQDYLSVHFCKAISLQDVASAIETSPFHLCRTFRKVAGMTIHAYLTQIRMRTALEWVRENDDLTRVALDLGYSSHSHFSSVFKRNFGITPRQWRELGS